MQLGDMYPSVLTLVLIAILVGVGLTVLGNLSNQISTAGGSNTTVNTAITAIGGFSNWFAIIVVVLVAAIIIGLVVKSFSGR